MKCPKCNMNVSDTATLCVHCGNKIQPPSDQSTQPEQNNVEQQASQIVEENLDTNTPPSVKKYLKYLLLPVIFVGIYFAADFYLDILDKQAKIEKEFEEESELYFRTISLLASTETLLSDGKEISSGELYYVLIDDDKIDKDHPLSSKEDKEKDRGLFDGKGYILYITGNSSLTAQGFACLNNGNNEKRYITTKATSFYGNAKTSNNSFDSLKLDETGKCDIKELDGRLNYSLHKLTRESKE